MFLPQEEQVFVDKEVQVVWVQEQREAVQDLLLLFHQLELLHSLLIEL